MNSRMNNAEEQKSNLKDRIMEITQTGRFAYMLGWHHDAEHTGAK